MDSVRTTFCLTFGLVVTKDAALEHLHLVRSVDRS